MAFILRYEKVHFQCFITCILPGFLVLKSCRLSRKLQNFWDSYWIISAFYSEQKSESFLNKSFHPLIPTICHDLSDLISPESGSIELDVQLSKQISQIRTFLEWLGFIMANYRKVFSTWFSQDLLVWYFLMLFIRFWIKSMLISVLECFIN